MDFQKDITTYIESKVDEYINLISKKYNISSDELTQIWKNNDVNITETTDTDEKEKTSELDLSMLHTYTKPVLVELCKQRGIKHTGKKTDLINTLLDNSKQTKLKPNTNKTTKKEAKQNKVKTQVLRKNNFDNYEYMIDNIRFVINKESNKIYGIQGDNGEILQLCEEDIEIIMSDGNFGYEIPLNLDEDNVDDIEELSEELTEEEIVELSEDEFIIEEEDD